MNDRIDEFDILYTMLQCGEIGLIEYIKFKEDLERKRAETQKQYLMEINTRSNEET